MNPQLPLKRGAAPDVDLESIVATTVMVAAAVALCYPLQQIILPSNLSLIFVPAVLFSALRYGLWPSILGSVLSVLSWNFFFISPRYSLAVDEPKDVLALALFLIVALVVSNLAALQKRQAEAIQTHAEATSSLYAFSQAIAATASLDVLLSVICEAIGKMLDRGVAIVLEDHTGEIRCAAFPPSDLDRERLTAALAALTANDEYGAGPRHTLLMGPLYRTMILRNLSRGAGLIAITNPPPPARSDHGTLVGMLVEHATVAVERLQLTKSLEQATLITEIENMRSSILASLSHDLRTPLTIILFTHSTLKTLGSEGEPRLRDELLDRAQIEAERLDRYIGNLLDMTRLEAGKLNIRLEPIDVGDSIRLAADRAWPLMAQRSVEVDIPPDLPLAIADATLLDQVIFNLLDNAAKYSTPLSSIKISATAGKTSVIIEITDEGPGIPSNALKGLFEKFTRVRTETRYIPGTGLGLAICRGFLTAMGGSISARNREDAHGAILSVSLRSAHSHRTVVSPE